MEEKLPADRIVEMHSSIINSTHKTQPKGHILLVSQTDVFEVYKIVDVDLNNFNSSYFTKHFVHKFIY